METRKYNPEDFVNLFGRLWEAEKNDLSKWLADIEAVEAFACCLGVNGVSWTITNDLTPVAVFGINVIQDGHGEAWIWFGPEMKGHKEELEKILAFHLKSAISELNLECVTTGVISGYEHLMGWVERLGFRKTHSFFDGKTNQTRYELCPHSLQ